ncbi:hypothetical protein [Nocardioides rubriscoriae]|uniref:hypothetical protein n=1 Tax=Nocardioides rubriscoriae TaxID=642762 RepID=UPI0011DF5C9C|nr:hypothetical protein [Nocardioides rubriscoriae]
MPGPVYNITSAKSEPVVTHIKKISLAPGGKYAQTTAITKVNTVVAGVTAKTEASFEAGAIFAKAQTKVGFDLKAEDTHTKTTAYTDYIEQSNSTRSHHTYAIYHGTTKVSGGWEQLRCKSGTGWTVTGKGTWKSWRVDDSGTTQCGLGTKDPLALAAQHYIGC